MSLTPKDIEAMLRAERATQVRPPAQVMERVLSNITASAVAAPASLVAKKTLLESVSASPVTWAAVAFVALGSALAVYSASRSNSPAIPENPQVAVKAEPQVISHVEPPSSPLPAPAPVFEVQPQPVPALQPAPTPQRPRTVARATAKDEPAAVSALAPSEADPAELELLERARAAIQAKRGGEALPWLDEHQQRFPKSVYSEERDSLVILGLLQANRGEEAQARSDEFFRAFPRSIHRSAIEKAFSAPPRESGLTDFPGPRN